MVCVCGGGGGGGGGCVLRVFKAVFLVDVVACKAHFNVEPRPCLRVSVSVPRKRFLRNC